MNKTGRKLDSNLFNKLLREALKIPIDKILSKWDFKVPELLAHYTNAQALEKILESKEIYATHYQYLNDPSELKLFKEVVRRIAAVKLKNLPSLKEDQTLKNVVEFKVALWTIISELNLEILKEPLFACFSENDDLLGQWRAYADKGKGYSLGLSGKWLMDRSLSSDFPFRLLPVIYSTEDHDDLVEEMLDSIIDYAANKLPEIEEDKLGTFVNTWSAIVTQLVTYFSPIIKHPAYCDEKEWRLIYFGEKLEKIWAELEGSELNDQDKISVRIANGNFVPYTVAKLIDSEKTHPFRKIRIGPLNKFKLEAAALNHKLNQLDYDDIKILPSEIPMRE